MTPTQALLDNFSLKTKMLYIGRTWSFTCGGSGVIACTPQTLKLNLNLHSAKWNVLKNAYVLR